MASARSSASTSAKEGVINAIVQMTLTFTLTKIGKNSKIINMLVILHYFQILKLSRSQVLATNPFEKKNPSNIHKDISNIINYFHAQR